jgi:hypothetical protein
VEHDDTGTDDLLRPTLTAADDACFFRRPWDPGHLTILTFFCGLPAGGLLFALNERRLGQSKRTGVTFAIVAVATLVIYGILSWLVASRPLSAEDGDPSRIQRVAVRAASIAVALFLASRQSARYRLSQAQGEPRGKLLGIGIAAFLAGNAAVVLLVMGLVALFTAILGPDAPYGALIGQ